MSEQFSPEDEDLRQRILRMAEQMAKAGWLSAFAYDSNGLAIMRTPLGRGASVA